MKVVYNKIIPFKGFLAINLFGILFVRGDRNTIISTKVYNHESIHTEQMKEMGYIFFYIWYFIEWLIRIITPPYGKAYRDISFEKEAYMNESNKNYLKNRKHYSWFKYL